MPAPASVQEFLDLVQKSGVADEGRVRAYLAKLTEKSALPSDPSKLAGQFVRDGLLTYFQAEQLLQGKWKRFSIGKYKVLERLGSGGMGQVFLCEHKLMRRRVAVKVLPTAKADDKASLARFYREAQAVAAVDHPNLVRAFDIDQEDNLHFLVMEWVDGTNLQDLVKKFGPLDITRACHYIYGSAVGLQHANEIGLIHRDIKPGNILIDRSGVVKILDMGLARFFHDEMDAITRQYDENVLGTADYLSPEQAIDSHTVDIRADIYSLGATFYYLLTGSAPFPEGSVAQKLIWHQNREPRPIKAVRPEVPDDVAAIVNKMMAKKAEDRYQTPTELMEALAPWVATPIPPPEERELPQLSPAATGFTGTGASIRLSGGSAPRSQSASPQGSLSGSPTLIAPHGGTPGSRTTPTVGDASPNSDVAGTNGVWESLDDDTQPVAQIEVDTGKVRPPAPKSDKIRTAFTPRKPSGSKRPLILIVGALLLVIGAGTGAYFAFFQKQEQPPTETPNGGRRLIVTKSGGENTFPSIALALRQALAGDTIVIADERIAEPLLRFSKGGREPMKDLTIESGLPDGRSAVIELAGPAETILFLSSLDNVHFRNIEFDGKGLADAGVQATGVGSGVTFENVTIRGVKRFGFRLQSIAAEPGRPFTIDRCRVLLPAAGDGVAIGGEIETRRVVVRNCRFEGPGRSGVRFDGPMVDVEVTGNRVFKAESGFTFTKIADGKTMKVQLTGNTVSEAKVGGAVFDFAPPEQKAKLDILVARNFFVRTPNAIRSSAKDATAIAGVTFQDNGFGSGTQPGNIPNAGSNVAGSAQPPEDQSDDTTFLRFPAGTGPTVGPNKVRVGAGSN